MAQNYIMLDVNDARAGSIAEVLQNKTCKRILGSLAETEMNESEIAAKLGIPANTVNYNVKKLVQSELIEQAGKDAEIKASATAAGLGKSLVNASPAQEPLPCFSSK